jgi:hypothetical protein
MHTPPDILMELAREKQAALVAAGEANRAAARAGGDERVVRRRLARITQAGVLRPWSRRPLRREPVMGAQRALKPDDARPQLRQLQRR